MKTFYRPELDALRFFAFLAVFAHHLLPENPELYHRLLPSALAEFAHNAVFAARYGVDLFFMLSSYLITSLLMREHDKTGRINIRRFYIRRILRIWPLYFTFAAFCLFIWPYLGFTSLELHHYIGLATFTENWSIIGWGWGDNPSALLWSVAVEEQFYLVWPVLMVVTGFKAIPRITAICVVIALIARISMYLYGASDSQIWFSTTSHIDFISAGAIVAYKGWCPVVDIGTSWLSQALIYLGKISFGLYVFHIAVQQIVVRHCSTLAMQVGTTFIVTVAIAAISYHFLEMPFLKLKERFTIIHSRP